MQLVQVDHRMSERPRTGNALGQFLRIFPLDHRLTAQFENRPRRDDAEFFLNIDRIGFGQLPGIMESSGLQFRCETVSHAPDLRQRKFFQHGQRIGRHHEHAGRLFFADVIGDLRKSLARCEPDPAGNADPLEHRRADGFAQLAEIGGIGQFRMEERLIDGILFHLGHELGQHLDHPAGNVAV